MSETKTFLNKIPAELQRLIYLASDIANSNNMAAYLVGGFVRDLLLGVNNLDLDIVVEGDGLKFAEGLSRVLKARIIRHLRFGTATVMLRPNLKVDIATARRETYPHPASLPVVTSGNLKDDLRRRDFTINAMAISIGKPDFGRLIDFFKGKDDLKNKKIRVLHNLSFIDDPTRILRAIRFEQRYNFKIEPRTLALLKEAVRLEMLKKVGPHRIRDELILILKEKTPLKQIRRIQKLAGLSFINPHLSVSRKIYQLLDSVGDRIGWFKSVYPKRRELDAWLIYFMGLIDHARLNDVKSICKRFSFCKGEEKRILSYKKLKSKFILALSRNRTTASQIFEILEPLSYEVILLIKAKYNNRNLQRHIQDFFEIYNGIRLYISGTDLHKLGVAPGPYYRKIFAKVLRAKMEGLLATKEEELVLIKRLLKP